MRTSTWLPAAFATAFLLAGCGSAPGNPGPADTTPAGTTRSAPAQGTPAQDTAVPGNTADAQQWPMPDLLGSVLQDAQDKIQSVTGGAVLISTSHDATGQHRNQVLDSNWQVCTQSVPAGDPITKDTLVDLGAVKLAETCP